ncbi:MAG: hypothetical protein PWQ89_1836 [Verrucomicrobiota bacterium]|nr:hypothetical protein [Verrucomicrobiota bacterium]
MWKNKNMIPGTAASDSEGDRICTVQRIISCLLLLIAFMVAVLIVVLR